MQATPATPPRVELRALQVFLVLAEELHFTRTAERVGLTGSRVSQTIRELEEHLGAALFTRTSRRVALTPLGRGLREELAPAYCALEQALTTTREQVTSVVGELRVGSYHLTNFGSDFVATSRDLEAVHPRVSVRLVDIGTLRDPLGVLRAHEVDALAMRLPVSGSDLVVGPVLSSERRVLAVARDHPLADRESVSYEDVADLVIGDPPEMPRELMDAFVPPRTPSGRLIERMRIETIFDVVTLVAAGRIVHPTVAGFVEYSAHPGIRSIPIDDLPDSDTALVWLADHQPPALLALAEIVASRRRDR